MKKWLKIGLLTGGVVVIVAAAVALNWQRLQRQFFKPTPTAVQQAPKPTEAIEAVQVVAQDLTIPWEVAFLPDGDLLVTERSGTLKRIGKNQQTYAISGVQHVGEGGLLGIALHPDFSQNGLIYLYLTTKSGGGLINRVERYRLENDQLSSNQVIIDNIPGADYHDGGRIAFGPDGLLYVTTGDAGQQDLAQNTSSLAGKILRLKDDGSIPSDNPFGNAVYSFGHRNSQGLAWDNNGQLWATEHGPSGTQSGYDELNRIVKGANYGWPQIRGDEVQTGMQPPVIQSGADETWAPAGMAGWDGSLWFAGLRGETLYEAKLNPDGSVDLKAHFRGEFGRLRAVVFGPDEFLYITTSNTDGRGDPKAGDDKIIKIHTSALR